MYVCVVGGGSVPAASGSSDSSGLACIGNSIFSSTRAFSSVITSTAGVRFTTPSAGSGKTGTNFASLKEAVISYKTAWKICKDTGTFRRIFNLFDELSKADPHGFLSELRNIVFKKNGERYNQ